MHRLVDRVRIKELLDAVLRLEDAAYRLERSPDPYLKSLAERFLQFAESDLVQELGMELEDHSTEE